MWIAVIAFALLALFAFAGALRGPRHVRIAAVVVLLAALAALLVWQPWRDRYDYAAAFEQADAAPARPLFQLMPLAGASREAVALALGEPLECEDSLYSSRCSYRPGWAEVVYVGGKADWFTIRGFGDTPPEQVLARIGLTAGAPTHEDAIEQVWTGIAGLREVRLVNDGGRVLYVRVKVTTP